MVGVEKRAVLINPHPLWFVVDFVSRLLWSSTTMCWTVQRNKSYDSSGSSNDTFSVLCLLCCIKIIDCHIFYHLGMICSGYKFAVCLGLARMARRILQDPLLRAILLQWIFCIILQLIICIFFFLFFFCRSEICNFAISICSPKPTWVKAKWRCFIKRYICSSVLESNSLSPVHLTNLCSPTFVFTYPHVFSEECV